MILVKSKLIGFGKKVLPLRIGKGERRSSLREAAGGLEMVESIEDVAGIAELASGGGESDAGEIARAG